MMYSSSGDGPADEQHLFSMSDAVRAWGRMHAWLGRVAGGRATAEVRGAMNARGSKPRWHRAHWCCTKRLLESVQIVQVNTSRFILLGNLMKRTLPTIATENRTVNPAADCAPKGLDKLPEKGSP